jgi:hypothetical protein
VADAGSTRDNTIVAGSPVFRSERRSFHRSRPRIYALNQDGQMCR